MNPRCSALFGAVALAISFVGVAPALAQTVGPEVVVRGDLGSTSDEFAAHTSDATFLVWADWRSNPEFGLDIYAQKLDPSGAPLWGVDGLLICHDEESQDLPTITPDGTGGAVVAWRDRRGNTESSSEDTIYAQRVSASGAIQWSANGVMVGGVKLEGPRPFIHPTSDGGFIVTWWDTLLNIPPATRYSLLAQKLDANGVRLWDPNLDPPSEEDPWGPGIEVLEGVLRGRSVSDGNGGIIAFGKIRDGGGFRFQRLAADQSTPWGAPVDLMAALDDSLPFEFASDGTGGVILVYRIGSAIGAFRIAGDGSKPWGPGINVSTSNNVTSQDPMVSGDGQGGAFISWVASSPRDVRVQHYSESGAALWEAGGAIVPDDYSGERDQKIAADGTGGVFVSYEGIASFNLFVRLQRLDSSGTALWSPSTSNGLSLTGAGDALIGSQSNGVSVVFAKGFDIAARKIYSETTTLLSRLANISTRAFVGAGAEQAIPGFAIGGTGNKEVLIRAIGPTLGGFGVPGALADPMLTLSDSASAVVATRDNWGEAGDAGQVAATSATVGAFPLDSGSLDAALVISLESGTTYTAGITGAGDGTGAGLVEVYDTGELGSSSFLSNLSSRVFVGTGDEQAIPGIVIEGNTPLTLLIRAVGPTLGGFGVEGTLADPTITLFNSAGVALATNDNWEEDGTDAAEAIMAAAEQVGAFELGAGSLDAAVVATLSPGSYTAGVTGVGDGTGVCLIEVYIVPPGS